MRLGSLLHLHFNSLLILDQIVGVFSSMLYLELLGHILQRTGEQQLNRWHCGRRVLINQCFRSISSVLILEHLPFLMSDTQFQRRLAFISGSNAKWKNASLHCARAADVAYCISSPSSNHLSSLINLLPFQTQFLLTSNWEHSIVLASLIGISFPKITKHCKN